VINFNVEILKHGIKSVLTQHVAIAGTVDACDAGGHRGREAPTRLRRR